MLFAIAPQRLVIILLSEPIIIVPARLSNHWGLLLSLSPPLYISSFLFLPGLRLPRRNAKFPVPPPFRKFSLVVYTSGNLSLRGPIIDTRVVTKYLRCAAGISRFRCHRFHMETRFSAGPFFLPPSALVSYAWLIMYHHARPENVSITRLSTLFTISWKLAGNMQSAKKGE